MRNKKINKVFKQVFKTFLSEIISSCQPFIDRVERCETYGDLHRILKNHGEDVAERLGVVIDDECYDCNKKEIKINDLENELINHSFTPRTLDDEYKLEAFLKAKDNFTVSEFESLVS